MIKNLNKNQKLFEFNKSNNPNINIKIGARISKIFLIFSDFSDTFPKETPKNEEAKIITAIPRLMAILANKIVLINYITLNKICQKSNSGHTPVLFFQVLKKIR